MGIFQFKVQSREDHLQRIIQIRCQSSITVIRTLELCMKLLEIIKKELGLMMVSLLSLVLRSLRLKMELNTKVNGALKLIKNTAMELRFGEMDRCTKDIGKTIKQTVGVD